MPQVSYFFVLSIYDHILCTVVSYVYYYNYYYFNVYVMQKNYKFFAKKCMESLNILWHISIESDKMGILSSKDVGTAPADEELRKILEAKKAEIKVIGAGGAGGNTISRLMQIGVIGAETIAINTDAQDLLYTDADIKILIGKEITGGLGAGAD